MPSIIQLHRGCDPSRAAARAAAALAKGELVAFPTETVYGLAANALLPEAVDRLRQSKERSDAKPLTVAIPSPSNALDWVPRMSRLGQRLVRRCWPGPVTLVFPAADNGLASRLPQSVRQQVLPKGSIGLRVPAHDVILHALRRLSAPVVLSSANRAGELPAVSAEEVLDALGNDVDLVLDDGPCRFGQASTVAEVGATDCKILREGVVTVAELQRQAATVLLFVCTGNTCRSPMAAALCKRLLADHLRCEPDQLPEHGFVVLSAGLAAMMGGRAAGEAIEAVRELGGDLGDHSSRPLTPRLVAQADYLITMTRDHLRALAPQLRGGGPKPRLLSPTGDDLPDPVGCDLQVYRECAKKILQDLHTLLREILPDEQI